MTGDDDRVPPEQKTYARWLDWGTRAGLVFLVGTFLAYAFELAAPKIPFHVLAQVWGMPLAEYRAATGAPDGWGWMPLAAHGDFMNLLGIAAIGLVTPACYLRVLPMLWSRGQRAYALIVVVEIVVLVAAASGWIGAGH